MLKKNNKILVGCLALLLVMAVGYALFSETITINGTATAKGEFDMTVTCTKGLAYGFTVDDDFAGPDLKLDNNYKNDSCTVTGNDVTYSVELTQPGATRNFIVKITNSGTIDALISIEELSNGSDDDEIKSCEGNLETETFSECQNGTWSKDDINGQVIAGFEKKDGTVVKAVETEESVAQIAAFVDESGENIVLKPGESVFLAYSSTWDARDSSNKVLFKEIIKHTYHFSQPTVN